MLRIAAKSKELAAKVGDRNNPLSCAKIADLIDRSKGYVSQAWNEVNGFAFEVNEIGQIVAYCVDHDIEPAGLFSSVTKKTAVKETAKVEEPKMNECLYLNPEVLKHFKLERDTFQSLRSQSDIILTPQVLNLSGTILNILDSGGMVALVGQSGVGKTILSHYIEHQLQNKRAKVSHFPVISFSSSSNRLRIHAFTKFMVEEFSQGSASPESPKRNRERRIQQLRELGHNVIKETGHPPVVILDNVEMLHGRDLVEIRKLHDSCKKFGPAFSVLFVGMDEFKATLFRSLESQYRIQPVQMLPLAVPLRVDESKERSYERAANAAAEYINQKFSQARKIAPAGHSFINEFFTTDGFIEYINRLVGHVTPKNIDNSITKILQVNYDLSDEADDGTAKRHPITKAEVKDAFSTYQITLDRT